ncbi:hypothetical protein [Wenxinia saemankumensis]|uniref:Uncharacterized protein n=1 Tax=Wenxinia saemankumensis TaxID=1447782 RepID=A0A1M6EIA2_9RHOB|nr:hypothetical protein [Wenxinia saemankumensis]SHI85171.1 hypothetical protein SAMN05444417_2011 [Wenxinia saemankumensis]
MRIAAAVALAWLASPAAAQVIRDCDSHIANARNLALPYDEATRMFANGDITLISLLLDEPACCGAHLMVLYPDPEDPFTACALVTTKDELGWSNLDLPGTEGAYDPATGLTLDVPARRWDGSDFAPFTLSVIVNQQTGVVRATAPD